MLHDAGTHSGAGDGKCYINYGESDQMEIQGYKQSKLKTGITIFFYILTFGLLRLIFHWYPHWQLYATYKKCDLEQAEKVLFVDDYKGKFRSYFVKKVKTFTLNDLSGLDDDDDEITTEFSYYVTKRRSSKLLTVHTDDGFQVLEAIRMVTCKKLRYAWNAKKKSFVKLKGLEADVTKNQLHDFTGYSKHEQIIKRLTYGRNEINVPVAGIWKLLALEALTPFYIFQVFSIVVWMAEVYYYYCIAIVLMSIVGIASSIMQTRKNQRNLRGTIHSVDKVTVCRGGTGDGAVFEDIPTTHLVPGDVVEIPQHGCVMHCDAVLLNGNCIVNESMLTGESVPVTKTPLPATSDMYDVREDGNHTLFCGTKVIQTRYYGGDRVLAVVIRTGYLTAKGQLVRSIMYPPPADFKFDQDSYKFIGVLAAIAIGSFIYTIATKTTRGIPPLDVLIKALDVVTIALPPALPAAMTVGKLYGLVRLKNHRIFCMNSRVINVSGSVNCVCFDKTGTLTEDGLDMWGVVPVTDGALQEAVKDFKGFLEAGGGGLLRGMAVCHSLTLIGGELAGDPLDVKMFEATGWFLEEPEVCDNNKFDLLVPTVVKPNNSSSLLEEIGIIHQYQFSSTLQRMSVVTKRLAQADFEVFCKGSPEMIVALSKPETVPANLLKSLKKYTEKGYRVIAMSTKTLAGWNYLRIKKTPREEIEKDLTFVGLIILENRLKTQTTAVIKELRAANIKTVMITGDNMQTALSVARDCGIVQPQETVIDVDVVKPLHKNENYRFTFHYNEKSNGGGGGGGCESKNKNCLDLEGGVKRATQHKFAMTGGTWAIIRDYYPELVGRVVGKGAVFARMSGEQKQQLIEELQTLGYYVAMCGDGANDCGALKAAHVGVSLSEAESSVASPFTAKEANIACVPKIIREGRAALVTSFGVFKFMLCYSLAELTSVLILYEIDSNLTSLEFLFIDIFLILNFASVFGKTEAYEGPIFKTPPMTSLMSFLSLASIISQMLIVIAFQVAVFYLIQTYDWFEPFTYDYSKDYTYKCYENYAVFCLSMFQYITLALVFSKGNPYRKPFHTNTLFTLSLVLTSLICVYMTVYPSEWLLKLFELQPPPFFDGRWAILLLAIVNFVCSYAVEEFVVGVLLRKFLRVRKKKSYLIDKQDGIWPIPDCDTNKSNNTVIVSESEKNTTRL